MRGWTMLLLSLGAVSAHASTQCPSATAQPLAVRTTVLLPVATGFASVNPQLGSQRGVLAPDFDESQSVDNVLWRLQVEGCQQVAAATPASALAAPAPGAYVKRTEHDNTPYRFNMTQNGKRMTADDFDAWLQANGYSAGRRAAPAAEAPAAPTPPAGEQSQ
ncbi:hypothetical protein [Luteimonas sp. SDU101]|uniref:hypothetical protein n=1 Tax=unclassified Luteimonas TaxID=2629088 RepID=UPI003EBA5DE7